MTPSEMSHESRFLAFNLNYEGNLLRCDRLTSDECKANLVFLHGAGNSTRHDYASLRTELLLRHVGSISFDFVGHGDTGGDIVGTSLSSRTDQASLVIRHCELPKPFFVFGSSMGAYTAIRLTSLFDIEGLILNVPAIYDRAAYSIPFGHDFSCAIRKNRSWERSDAVEVLSAFKGKVVIITASADVVIPDEVVRLLETNCRSARSVSHLILHGESHQYDINRLDIRQKILAHTLNILG